MMEQNLQHIPVMANQVLELLKPLPGQHFLDCTVGGGGHARMILERTAPHGKLYGIDRDPYALGRAREALSSFGDRVELFHGEYSGLQNVISRQILSSLHGALIDCGVSSFQLDAHDRGFSFRFDAPLDMRMNSSSDMSAKAFLSHIDEDELADVIYELGEERNSRKIAKNIVHLRGQKKLNTTFDLVEAVMKSFPPRHYWKIHPATKTFQAIRMKVNEELDEIERGIASLLSGLQIGSKIVVITFHSLEDRLVKLAFRKALKENRVKLLNKKPLAPTREETLGNPRARSAKVRGVEIISHEE